MLLMQRARRVQSQEAEDLMAEAREWAAQHEVRCKRLREAVKQHEAAVDTACTAAAALEVA